LDVLDPSLFPSPTTRSINLAATLARTYKHFWRCNREYKPSGEAKERQQAFLAPLPEKQYALDIFLIGLSQFGEPSFSESIPTPFLVYGVVSGFDSSSRFHIYSESLMKGIPTSCHYPLKSFSQFIMTNRVDPVDRTIFFMAKEAKLEFSFDQFHTPTKMAISVGNGNLKPRFFFNGTIP
jgi:hypothetical protein